MSRPLARSLTSRCAFSDRRLLVALCLCCWLPVSAAGCKGGERGDEAKADADGGGAGAEGDARNEPAAETSAGAGEATGGDEAGADGDTGGGETGGDEEAEAPKLDVTVGVEVCDTYAAAWKACIAEKAPEGDRATLEKELAEQLAAWKQTVDGGGSAAAVEIGCTTARETAKAQGETWGCEL